MNARRKMYFRWRNMLRRCYDIENIDYANYGGRGITVCEEWLDDFRAFCRDVGRPPSSEHTLDRKDNDKGYYKENCRWATKSQQAINRRPQHQNKLGIKGVLMQGPRYLVRVRRLESYDTLYSGRDFFEACCARKSFDFRENLAKE